MFDDDTGQPVLMDGTSVPGGQAFTASAWTVTDGAIITTSATTITIPVYPIGNQLSALAITVGLGLGILAGDPVRIVDTLTGKNTMTGYVVSYVPATGALVVQIGYSFDLEIRRTGPHHDGSGYMTRYDFGVGNEHGLLLRATLGNGVLITDIGVLQILIPVSALQKLRGGTYSVGMICSDSVNTRQLFVGQLPVQWGGVGRQPLPAVPGAYNPSIF